MTLKLYMGCPSSIGEILMIRTVRLPEIMSMTPVRTVRDWNNLPPDILEAPTTALYLRQQSLAELPE